MASKQLLTYVQKALERGHSAEQIRTVLEEQGWAVSEIADALARGKDVLQKKLAEPLTPPVPSKKSDWNIDLKNLSASQVLLFLGGLIVVLAGIIYIAINWSQWGILSRIFAIFFPMLVCYATGSSLFLKEPYKKQGAVFLVVGSLLFPLFLSITFRELELFAEPFNEGFNFTVFLLSFFVYLASSRVFIFPVWSFLYLGTGIFVYYFFLRLLGVDGFFNEPTVAWFLLIPGTAYLWFSLWYQKREQKDEGNYALMLGFFVIAFSFMRLFGESFARNKESLAFLLLVLGGFYFVLGLLFEKNSFKRACHAPYLIATVVVFFSLGRLANDGALIEMVTGVVQRKMVHELVGWSYLIIGIVYALIGLGLGRLKKALFAQASMYQVFFDFISPFWILGSLLFLGLDGSKPLYETLLLLASLGFIFLSIPKASPRLLYTGTLFLVIYIFSIGGEYFQNDVGWPITLFVTGLASMGIGVAMEKMRRKYFPIQNKNRS